VLPSDRVAAASRSGGSFFLEYKSSFLKDSSFCCVLLHKTWSGRELGKGNQSLCCCPASSGQQLFKFVKIEVQKQQPPKESAAVQTMSDLPASEKKEQPSEGMKNLAVVQCDGFRCLAYRDGEVWREFQSGKPLPEVKSVVFTFAV
jgi:hypothetical protein